MQGEKMLDIQPRSTFGPVDFAAMGRAMGARGYRAETLEEARVALRDAWQGQGPAVIDILTSDDASPSVGRSEGRRVGKECVSTCRSRWAPEHYKKKHTQQHKTN